MSNDFLCDIDVEAILADLAELDRECGDWREHIGFEAACTYKPDKSIRDLYAPHATGCAYCQEMIELYSGNSNDV